MTPADVSGFPAHDPSVFRLYEPGEAWKDGYPEAWHTTIKHVVRAQDGHRCLRCGHPYTTGAHPMERNVEGDWVSWSPCDGCCTHGGEVRWRDALGGEWHEANLDAHGVSAAEARLDDGPQGPLARYEVQARFRVLTVHHLDGNKLNCRWWNLVSLDQRCHLNIQRRVLIDRVYPWEHSDWFKPYAAGFYAWIYLGLDLSRQEVDERLEELLSLERLA